MGKYQQELAKMLNKPVPSMFQTTIGEVTEPPPNLTISIFNNTVFNNTVFYTQICFI